jgi:GGDEF domain-containing protein
MKNGKAHWSKNELKIYILLLCANADKVEKEEEVNLIKSQVKGEEFTKIYNEFSEDSEDQALEKIKESVSRHHFSHRELVTLHKEMQEVFFVDDQFKPLERNLETILNNIIY